MNTHLTPIHLSTFRPIALSELNEVSLMKRIDTKFIVNINQLESLLHRIQNDYRVLEIDNHRLMTYKSTYFDTEDALFYQMHHNGISNRIKIRIRNYMESNLQFLEIKQKSNQGHTNKKRVKVHEYMHTLDDHAIAFIQKTIGQQYTLRKSIENQFNRFTLVNTHLKERVTFDLNLEFNHTSFNANMVIIEIKQAKLNRASPIFAALRSLRVYPNRISKYCLGMAKHDPLLKQNNFKPKFQKINKITAS